MDNLMTGFGRRDFMRGTAASAAFLATHGAFAGAGARLRIGLLADPHVVTKPGKGVQNCRMFEPALRLFGERGADGILVAGDLTDLGTVDSLRRVGEIWDRAFPGGKRQDGAPVAKLLHFGDHDMGGYAHKYEWGPRESERPDEVNHPICEADYASLWEECFHERFAPVMLREVNGYQFVLANHPPHSRETRNGCFIPGLAEALAAVRRSPERPFFYSQHRIPKGTACPGDPRVCDTGESTEILRAYPECIAFCGHGHKNCADDLNLWQGEFTVVEIPSVNFCTTRPGYENGYSSADNARKDWPMRRIDINRSHQGMFATVYDDRIVIERIDLLNRQPMGFDWVIPLPAPDGTASVAARSSVTPAPEFPERASAALLAGAGKRRDGSEMKCITIRFPIAKSRGTHPRAFDYEVLAKRGEKALLSRSVFSDGCMWGESREGRYGECIVDEAMLPQGWRSDVRFSVCPRNAFGKRGLPLRATKPGESFVWACLVHLGTNMWGNDGVTPETVEDGEEVISKTLRCDDAVWRRTLDRLAKSGANMVLIDVGDGVLFPSHPELAVKGAWTPDKMLAEVRRLRGMGLEPIPKLNFATTHDQWLKVYNRMVGTTKYYEVCRDVINDTCEMFDSPRLFHIGMDEECMDQKRVFKGVGTFRDRDFWFHDVKFYADVLGKRGVRAWMWSDAAGDWPEEYVSKCPKDIIQSVGYYHDPFDKAGKAAKEWFWSVRLEVLDKLDKAGFEQVPTGSNYYSELGNTFAKLMAYVRQRGLENVSGGLQTSWRYMLPGAAGEDANVHAIGQLQEAIRERAT